MNSYIECVLALIFADPQREGYKFHSLLGSVGKLSAETNFNFPAPPFNHFPGICKTSSRHVYKPTPHRVWVFALIVSALSMEVKVALPYRRYFES